MTRLGHHERCGICHAAQCKHTERLSVERPAIPVSDERLAELAAKERPAPHSFDMTELFGAYRWQRTRADALEAERDDLQARLLVMTRERDGALAQRDRTQEWLDRFQGVTAAESLRAAEAEALVSDDPIEREPAAEEPTVHGLIRMLGWDLDDFTRALGDATESVLEGVRLWLVLTEPEEPEHIRKRSDVGLILLENERLGRVVRAAWVGWAAHTHNPKPSWLVPWARLPEPEREVDRIIGRAVMRDVAGASNTERDTYKARAEAAEAQREELAAAFEHLREKGAYLATGPTSGSPDVIAKRDTARAAFTLPTSEAATTARRGWEDAAVTGAFTVAADVANAAMQSEAVSRDRAAAAGRDVVSSHRQAAVEALEAVRDRLREMAQKRQGGG